jgi:hypothetical protein
MSLLDTASLVVTPNGTKASKLYSVVPSSGAGDLSVTRATTATRVNSAGLIESVASNVPRLDYTNGSCPSILVEPQRTNLVTYSEDFTNAVWERYINGTATMTITANATTAPNGTNTADLVAINRGFINEVAVVYKVTNTPAGTYKGSVWLKAKDSASVGKTIDLWSWDGNTNGYTMVTLTANWVRYEQVTTVFSGTGQELFDFGLLSNNYSTSTTLSVEFYIWGAQSEAGSYATSYIPTTSASVTRNADVISKTGISSLIGQTEGTLFVDLYRFNIGNPILAFQLNNGSINDRVQIELSSTGQLFAVCVSGGTTTCLISGSTLTIGQRYKIAFSYKLNDFKLYLNGIQDGSDTNGLVPTSMSNAYLGNEFGTSYSGYNINTASLWKTALTNTQLAQLTTI